MKKNDSRLVLGIALIALAALFILDRVGVMPFNPFFNGWWTLFLIIPGIFSIVRQGIRVGNALLVVLGVFFLLDEQGWDTTHYILPAVLVVIGIALIVKKN